MGCTPSSGLPVADLDRPKHAAFRGFDNEVKPASRPFAWNLHRPILSRLLGFCFHFTLSNRLRTCPGSEGGSKTGAAPSVETAPSATTSPADRNVQSSGRVCPTIPPTTKGLVKLPLNACRKSIDSGGSARWFISSRSSSRASRYQASARLARLPACLRGSAARAIRRPLPAPRR
jgi:hypothetical protein